MGFLSKKKGKGKDREGHRRDEPDHAVRHVVAPATRHDDLSDLGTAQVLSALEAYGLHYDASRAKRLLMGRFSHGDPNRAVALAFVLRDAEDMILVEPTALLLQGAENVRGTTCYLDALLFSMFSRSFPIFDTLLYYPGHDARSNKLIVHLRVFINLLRGGHLVTHDLVDMLRHSIADCGWEDARSSAQQDTSECFGFIAEMLQMPMLTFKVYIAHGGKEDAHADHKIVQERFLALSIPRPKRTGGPIEPIELVDLIDAYFYTKLEVRRPVARSRSTMQTSGSFATESSFALSSGSSTSARPPAYVPSTNPFYRAPPLNSNGYPEDKKSFSGHAREVSMQAWQLFELVPYYTATDRSTQQIDFARQPPVVAICLKRYYFDDDGTALINPTPVIIPEFIDFTPFTDADNTIRKSGRHIRLRLESAVCHRGQHVGSGHYVSVSRNDAAPGSWLLFDDLARDRVTQGTFQQLLSLEVPYLLFYQLETVRPPRPSRRLPSLPGGLIPSAGGVPPPRLPPAPRTSGPDRPGGRDFDEAATTTPHPPGGAETAYTPPVPRRPLPSLPLPHP